jgi:hypothetical protein
MKVPLAHHCSHLHMDLRAARDWHHVAGQRIVQDLAEEQMPPCNGELLKVDRFQCGMCVIYIYMYTHKYITLHYITLRNVKITLHYVTLRYATLLVRYVTLH